MRCCGNNRMGACMGFPIADTFTTSLAGVACLRRDDASKPPTRSPEHPKAIYRLCCALPILSRRSSASSTEPISWSNSWRRGRPWPYSAGRLELRRYADRRPQDRTRGTNMAAYPQGRPESRGGDRPLALRGCCQDRCRSGASRAMAAPRRDLPAIRDISTPHHRRILVVRLSPVQVSSAASAIPAQTGIQTKAPSRCQCPLRFALAPRFAAMTPRCRDGDPQKGHGRGHPSAIPSRLV